MKTYGGVKTLESLEVHDSCTWQVSSLAPDALSGDDGVLVALDRTIGEEVDVFAERVQASLLFGSRIDRESTGPYILSSPDAINADLGFFH
jgi:hypothetical protein